jgi:hypothetical protein
MKRLFQISLVFILPLAACTKAAPEKFIDQIEGVYVVKGAATVPECEGCDPAPVKDATDCVVIKKQSDKIAHVFLNLVGENGHSCSIDSEENFVINKDSLFFSDHDEVAKDQPQLKTDGIYVFKNGNSLTFKVQPQSLDNLYCGVSMGIDGYSISTASRQIPWKKGVALPNDPKQLDKYCPKFNQE